METKYIFITGGVASSLGKGIISASLGKLLQARGYRITIQKFDPYINIDPGTLNPYEHGECYVTYLGKTIQVVPHITDEIKRRILCNATKQPLDFVITEIGGTIGDIESQPFLEAIRQLRWELGPQRALNVHLTYVPYLAAADELKTKPTQTSVKQLQGLGIQPEVLILRTEHHAHFCNVAPEAVIQSQDLPSIYEVPINMYEHQLDRVILSKMGIKRPTKPDLKSWLDFLDCRKRADEVLHIGLVGKYDLQDAYKSIRESLAHAGTYRGYKVQIHFINSEFITRENVAEQLSGMAGIVICPGFGQRGIDGKILAAEYTRTHDIPTFGICLGFQMMVIEFARNVLGYQDANSSEMDETTPHNVIDMMAEQKNITQKGGTMRLGANVIDMMAEQKNITQKGGTMRLGAYECALSRGSRTAQAYHGQTLIKERHRHRYEFNNSYKDEYEKRGMKCAGINPSSDLVEIMEIPALRWYIGTQFHPEYSSTVLHPHPLFLDFIAACIKASKDK